jgi:hypothetical protein
MNVTIVDPGHLVPAERRALILAYQGAMSGMEGAMFDDCMPLKHIFTPGLYARELTVPADFSFVGKLHKTRHISFILSGHIKMFTENGGTEEVIGPVMLVTEPGTKRAVHVIDETVWVTVHANPDNETDLQKLEDMIIAPSYEALEMLT